MKTLFTLASSGSALLVAIALVLGAAALVPVEAEAGPCFCPSANSESIMEWGKSTVSCAAARNNCPVLAINAAEDFCAALDSEVCAWGDFRYTSGCYVAGGKYIYDCEQNFACEECLNQPNW